MGYGAYGKLPALGDFVRIGLGRDFVSAWDEWLQSGLLALSESLGEQWEALYMSAPIWRFSLQAGDAGPAPVSGVMMPSVDRVGRKFPLTLAAQQDGGGVGLMAHLSRDTTFVQLENLVLASLEDSMTVDSLREGLEVIQPVEAPAVVLQGGGDLTVARVSGEGASQAGLAAALASNGFDGQSLWSAHLDGDCRLLACNGLPGPDGLAALFDLDAAIWKGESA